MGTNLGSIDVRVVDGSALRRCAFALLSLTACSSSDVGERETSKVVQAACTSPISVPASPPNSGFDTDANNNGIPDGWTQGGTGTVSLPDGFDQKSLRLAPGASLYDVFVDSPPAPINPICANANKVLIRVTALTSGSLNIAHVEVNAYSNTIGSGSMVAGYALDVRNFPGRFHTFTLLQGLPSTAQSFRARLRAHGTGYVEFDDLYVAATDGTTGSVHPVLNCVKPVGPGVYDALFGYVNDQTVLVDVPIGPENTFSPLPQGRAQIEHFAPGRVDRAFAVRFDGSPLDWTMTGGTVTASSQSTACATTACSPACANGEQCIDGACVTDCGDGLCADVEGCRKCAADCSCGAGMTCFADRCARPARCGIEWECGSDTSFGVPVDCGQCPNGVTCRAHLCR